MFDKPKHIEIINGVSYTITYDFDPMNILQRIKVLKVVPKCPLSDYQLSVKINERLIKTIV